MVNPLRYSLAALSGVILLVGVYLAAVRQSTTWAAELALTLTIGVLTAGLLWAVFRPNADRRFWVGVHLGGWGYLLLAFSSWSQAQLGSYLVTTPLLITLHQQMPIANPRNVMVEWHGSWYPAEVLERNGGKHFIRYQGYGSEWDEWIGPDRIRGQLGPFIQIGHALLSLLVALAGGAIAVCLGAANRSRRQFWIAWGLCVAAVVAVGVVAVVTNFQPAASAALSMLMLVLLLAALAAWVGLPRQRSFALGFTILAGGYLLLNFAPGLETAIGPNLLSTRLLQQVQERLHPSPAPPTSVALLSYRMVVSSPNFVMTGPSTGQRMSACIMAGHSLFAAMLGMVGGLAALWMSRRTGNADNAELPTAPRQTGSYDKCLPVSAKPVTQD